MKLLFSDQRARGWSIAAFTDCVSNGSRIEISKTNNNDQDSRFPILLWQMIGDCMAAYKILTDLIDLIEISYVNQFDDQQSQN